MAMGIYKIGLMAKSQYIFMLISLVAITLVCAAFSFNTNDNFDLAKQEILLRKIGHDVLLNAGDSTSRVLPVKKIAENEYQIRFENEFTFKPDSLVSIIKKSLAKDKLVANYVVNVLNCTNNDVIFGYVILKNEKSDIVPCSGRAQPKGCYLIELKFENKHKILGDKGYLIGGIPLLAFVGLLITRSVKTKRKQSLNTEMPDDLLKIGYTFFDAQKRNLIFAENKVSLTAKENKLLLIFAKSPNLIIERSRLQKEIWEDEGVIVGRSLDMFISKLRKKLENDVSIQLINIHGKGYKLEVNC
jgi:hypothetical protein